MQQVLFRAGCVFFNQNLFLVSIEAEQPLWGFEIEGIEMGGVSNLMASDGFSDDVAPRETKDLIGIVASKHTFSECLCRTVESELDDVRIRRFGDMESLLAQWSVEAPALRLLIVDENIASELDEATASILLSHSDMKIACAYREVARAREIMSSGLYPDRVSSFLPMNLVLDAWIKILALMVAGHPYVSHELIALPDGFSQVMHRDHSAKATQANDAGLSNAIAKLTAREVQVLRFVAAGCANKEIAARMSLSVHTVKLHIHHIISKLGVHNRTEAALLYAKVTEQ